MFMKMLKKLASKQNDTEVLKITPLEAHETLSRGELILIDVREPNEWAADGSPDGCHCIALQNPNFLEEVLQSTSYDKSAKIAVSCRSGMRGDKAAKLLFGAGFDNVLNVDGGMLRWVAEELPIST